jgi:hypothetical protein
MVSNADATSGALARRYARSDRMIGRRIAGEYVLVPIVGHGADLDAIYNLNSLGAFIWEQLDGKTAGVTIVNAIVARYDVEFAQAAEDFVTFLGQLQTIRAVAASDEAGPTDEAHCRIAKKEK